MVDRGFSLSIPQVAPKGFVVIDTETTGGKEDSRVIELGMAFLSPQGTLQKTFSTLLYGEGTSGEWYVKRVHRISDSDLIGAPKFKQLVPDFLKSIEGRVLFAHNANFDLRRLNHELSLVRRRQIQNMGCTIELGQRLGHGRLSLEKATDKFNLFRQNSHHALHDALATSQLLQHYIAEDKQGVQEYLSGKGFKI